MSTQEHAIVFPCEGDDLVGILHAPSHVRSELGMVVVVGGPQYRVGSHRQFVLMSRDLSRAGWPVFRFDYRGMGDSGGEPRTFEAVNADIRAAIDTFTRHRPEIRGVLLWGLCDAASAAMMYGPTDARVRGLVLVNPWVRTVAGEARAYLRHYYLQRLLQPSFWRKVFSGKFNPVRSASDLTGALSSARQSDPGASQAADPGFIHKMRIAWSKFKGSTLVLISEVDLTAKEFVDLCAKDAKWRVALSSPSVALIRLAGADHTFSSRATLNEATRACVEWLTRAGGPCNVRS